MKNLRGKILIYADMPTYTSQYRPMAIGTEAEFLKLTEVKISLKNIHTVTGDLN